MAREGVAASGQYMWRAAPITAVPITMAGFFRITNNSALMYLDNSSLADHRHGMVANPGTPLHFQVQGTVTTQTASTTADVVSGALHHAAAVAASATDRKVYLDGGNVGTNTVDVTATITTLHLGVLNLGGTLIAPITGSLGEWALWSAALSAEEIAALAKGWDPRSIRPQNLVAIYRLFGNLSPEPDYWKDKRDLTLVNAPTKADHPRMIYAY